MVAYNDEVNSGGVSRERGQKRIGIAGLVCFLKLHLHGRSHSMMADDGQQNIAQHYVLPCRFFVALCREKNLLQGHCWCTRGNTMLILWIREVRRGFEVPRSAVSCRCRMADILKGESAHFDEMPDSYIGALSDMRLRWSDDVTPLYQRRVHRPISEEWNSRTMFHTAGF